MYQLKMFYTLNLQNVPCQSYLNLKKNALCKLDLVLSFLPEKSNEHKILAALTNAATRWQRVTSDGIALHLGLLGLGDQGVNRGVCRGHERGRDGILFVCLFCFCFCFFLKYLFIYLFIYGCVGSSFLCEGFL